MYNILALTMKIDYACQSSESLRRSWNKMLKVTIQHPFKLRTEVHYYINFLNSVYIITNRGNHGEIIRENTGHKHEFD